MKSSTYFYFYIIASCISEIFPAAVHSAPAQSSEDLVAAHFGHSRCSCPGGTKPIKHGQFCLVEETTSFQEFCPYQPVADRPDVCLKPVAPHPKCAPPQIYIPKVGCVEEVSVPPDFVCPPGSEKGIAGGEERQNIDEAEQTFTCVKTMVVPKIPSCTGRPCFIIQLSPAQKNKCFGVENDDMCTMTFTAEGKTQCLQGYKLVKDEEQVICVKHEVVPALFQCELPAVQVKGQTKPGLQGKTQQSTTCAVKSWVPCAARKGLFHKSRRLGQRSRRLQPHDHTTGPAWLGKHAKGPRMCERLTYHPPTPFCDVDFVPLVPGTDAYRSAAPPGDLSVPLCERRITHLPTVVCPGEDPVTCSYEKTVPITYYCTEGELLPSKLCAEYVEEEVKYRCPADTSEDEKDECVRETYVKPEITCPSEFRFVKNKCRYSSVSVPEYCPAPQLEIHHRCYLESPTTRRCPQVIKIHVTRSKCQYGKDS
eukprot:GHVT01000543.1.p1 GENE.GHVT01000543.1~~GHVT01000543.1.p1  ORF type:complete len:479 (+),score=19.00 GHVT01000543.1:202-1638(+)